MSVYVLSGANSDLTGGADFSKALVLTGATSTTISFSVATNTTETSYAWTPSGDPGTIGITGTYTVKVNITTGSNNGRLAISLSRVNSAGTAQSTSTATAEQTTSAGTLTFTLTSINLGTWASGDRLRVNYAFRNVSTMSTISLGVSTGSATTDTVDVPWTNAVTHDTSGALSGPGSTVAGTSSRLRAFATSGALSGPGSSIAGSAEQTIESGRWDISYWDAARWMGVQHGTSGALVGPGSSAAGTANRFRAFATSGALSGAGANITGTATKIPNHITSGALSGAGATVSGSAARTREHATTGVLSGAGSSVVGTAFHSALHATSGALTGAGSTVAGTANRTRVHATAGVLSGAGSAVTGDANRTRVHNTAGALSPVGSSVVGSAERNHYFDATGALVGPGSAVSGDALRYTQHDTTGDLIGPGSAVDGYAENINDINHFSSGALVGPGSAVTGEAVRTPGNVQPVVTADVGPGDEKQRKKAQKKRDEAFERERQEQERLRQQIKQAVEPVVEQAKPVVVSEGTKSIQVLSVDGSRLGIPVPPAFDPAEVAKIVAEVLEDARVQAEHVKRRQDAQRALEAAKAHVAQIIKRKRDDELLMLMD